VLPIRLEFAPAVYPVVTLAAVPPDPPAPIIIANDVDGLTEMEVAEI
jgi:hypothetical protein